MRITTPKDVVRGLLFLALPLSACAVGTNAGLDVGGDDGGTLGADGNVADAPPRADAASSLDGTSDSPGFTPDASLPDSGLPDASARDASADTATTDGGCVAHGYTGALATFDLSAQTGSETSAAATTSATGITAGALTRAAALTATAGTGSINSSNWPTTASADAARYYAFTIQPAAGCTVSLTTLALDVKASATGPANGDVATSSNNFATHFGTFAGSSTPTVTFSNVSGSSAIEVRVYGFGASSTGGTFRIQNTMTLSGTIN